MSRKRGWNDILAGSLSGVCQVTTVQPADLVKVRLQTSISNIGPWECAKHIYRTEGALAFYKGMSSMLVMVPVSSSIMFAAYGQALSWTHQFMQSSHAAPTGASTSPSHRLSLGQYFLCGGFAGCVSALSYCPQELVKVRLQMQRRLLHEAGANAPPPQYKGSIDCLRQIIQLEGFRGLYRGLGATMIRDFPATGAWYAGYEAARNFLNDDKPNPPVWMNAASVLHITGSFGGMCYWIFGFPQDVAKSRIQMSPLPPSERPNTIKIIVDIVRHEGIRRLYRGLSTCLLRAIPSSGVLFGSYQYFYDILSVSSLSK